MFVSKKFELLFEDIVNMMPGVIFYGIILTYCITAALNVYFLTYSLLLISSCKYHVTIW
jgi:hypothetical protein